MAPTESYIVRIYRRGRKNTRLIAGIVEKVGGDTRKAGFDGIEELNDILTSRDLVSGGEAGETKNRENGDGEA